jgi:hypothetical protein
MACHAQNITPNAKFGFTQSGMASHAPTLRWIVNQEIMRKKLLVGLFSCLLASSALAQSLSPVNQKALGVTAAQEKTLQVVKTVTPKAGAEPRGLVMENVAFTNAGGNRSLWRIDFADAFPEDNSNIIFYIDTDNNPKTGRQDFKGIDLMLWVENGATRTAFYTPEGSIATGPQAFAAIEGKQLFVSFDLDLHQKDGATVVPMTILAQTNQPLQAVSDTGFFEMKGAPQTSAAKAPRIEPNSTSENVVSMWGLHEIRRLKEDKNNIVLPIEDAKMDKWFWDQRVEYRENSALLTSGRGVISATVPQSGRYYPAFIFYDDGGMQSLSISVNGQKKGVAVADTDDWNQKLFALSTPFDLKKGDTVELRNLNNNGNYRNEDLLLLKTIFPQEKLEYQFQNIAATHPWQDPSAMRLTFTTTWPAKTKIQYGASEKFGKEVEEQTIPLNNHRVFLRGLNEGQKVFYRLVANDRAGKPVVSKTQSLVFQKPKYPSASAQTKTVALKLSTLPQTGAWPVSGGVPIGQGEVYEVENLRLTGANNAVISAQKKVLARWHDGSIKWVLLSFLAPAGQSQFALQYGAQIRDARGGSLAAKNPNGGVSVDTGVLQWRAEPQADGALKISILQNGKDVLKNARLVIEEDSGKIFSSDFKPDEITVEENGDQRAVITMRGSLASSDKTKFFRYETRWQFARGSSIANVRVSLVNDQAKNAFSEIKSANLRFDLPAANAQVQLGELGTFAASPNAKLGVLQSFDDAFSAQTPDGEKKGKRFPGWLDWKNGAQNISLAVRDFWQLYPKALEVRGDVLEIGLAPQVSAADYARFKGTVEEYRSVYYLMNGNYKLRAGVSFTTEIALDVNGKNGAQLSRFADHPPLLIASPQHYRDSKAFGNIALGDEFPLIQSYDEKAAGAFKNYLADRDKLHEYGLLNYGDWWGERGINWGNIEYDTQHAFIMQFARTGDVSFFRAGADAAIHNRDVDTIQYDIAPPERDFSPGGGSYSSGAAAKGRAWAHSIGHTGGYFSTSPVEGQGSPSSGFTSSHTWTEGLYEHYFLTGDTRSLETANSIADVYDTYGTLNYDFTNCRVPGWTLIFTMGAYNATNDPFYLNAARIIVDRVLERQTPDGGWDRQLVPGHCTHTPRHHGNAGFMAGVLMSGLKYYAEASGDQRAKDSIVKAANFMIDDMWIPEAKAFRYTSCPTSSVAPGLNFLIGEGVAYAWRQNKDARLRRVSLDAMETIVARMDGMGKNISMEMRATPRQLFDIEKMLQIVEPVSAVASAKIPAAGAGSEVQFSAEAKTLQGKIEEYSWDFGDATTGKGQTVSHAYPNGGAYRVRLTARNSAGQTATHTIGISVPPPALQKLDTTRDVMIQAEDFSSQGLDEVSVVEGRAGSVGKAITKWEATPGHWVEWKFEAPADATYEIALKYATASVESKRSLTIDGKTPAGAEAGVLLPTTGGYSTSADDWKMGQVLDGNQKPLRVPLSKGAHTLRLANEGGGLALDFILLRKTEG